jgi:DNA repair exonuclease SbcCD ATPase subunit
MSEIQSKPVTNSSPTISRIDPAHRKPDAAPLDPASSTLAEQFEGAGTDQVLIHAGQLAGHLRSRQRDLDRREAQLNSRSAQLDKDIRASRMWFQEREKEAAQRESELQQQISELEERAAAIAASEISSDHEGEAADRETARKRAIDKADELLNKQFAKLKSDREQLNSEREQFRAQRAGDEEAAMRREQRYDAALAKKKRQLDHRSRFLDDREATLDQLQGEVARQHRESLEMRFIVEQLWTQLAGKIAPAVLTKSVSETRRKLAQLFEL